MTVSMIVAATLTVGVDCPKCKYAVPVNGIADGTRCENCAAHVPLDWKRILDLSYVSALDRAVDLSPGRQDKSPFQSIHLVVERLEPACMKCRATLPSADLVARASEGRGTCAACGATFALRTAPAPLRDVYPAARALVHEGIVTDASAVDEKREPIVFACMSCGAALALDGADRTVSCRFCTSANYLPDGVWLRLHPPRQLEPFVVLSVIDEVGSLMSEYRKGSYEKAEKDAQRADLPAARLMALARGAGDVPREVANNPSCTLEMLMVLAVHEDWRVRDPAARHANATEATRAALVATSERLALAEVGEDDEDLLDSAERGFIAADERSNQKTLAALARTGGERVRAALAGNPAAPFEIVRDFIDDEEEDVRIALARRRDLPADVTLRFARDEEARVRAVVARRDDLSAETFAALAADRKDEVRLTVAKNPKTPADIIAKLAKSDDEGLSQAAKAHPSYKRKWWDIF